MSSTPASFRSVAARILAPDDEYVLCQHRYGSTLEFSTSRLGGLRLEDCAHFHSAAQLQMFRGPYSTSEAANDRHWTEQCREVHPRGSISPIGNCLEPLSGFGLQAGS